jgi:transcription elongation factor GreA
MGYTTQAGIDALNAERDVLKARLATSCNERSQAGTFVNFLNHEGHHDLAECLKQESFLADRLARVDRLLAEAQTAPIPNHVKTVAFGHLVRLAQVRRGIEVGEFTAIICGHDEPDLYESVKNVSNVSPLGRKLIKKCVGDILDVTTPKGVTEYEILEISIPDSDSLELKKVA